jgi:site-specific DNA recombinase
VAAYCRVSSSSEDQLNSFAAQNIHYTQYITEHEDWRLVDIYADEGITGTSVEKREDFRRMLADSGRGLIDRILVKSISRFARNTSECLEAIRQFRANGTTIFFEKENIDTARASSELMTALYAAFAQAESESISGNIRWSYQKRIERERHNPQSAGFGYCLKDGKLAIVPEEAKIVRFIFESYLSGASRRAIVKQLNTTTGGKLWHESAISYILTNECYMGDTMLQKTYSTGPLPVKRHRNTGQRKQYYIPDTHPAIIAKDDFEKVQILLEMKKTQYTREKRKTEFPFAKKLCCRECGSTLRRKGQKESAYWCCMTHDADKNECALLPIPEVQIQQAFLRLYYNLKHQGSHILPDLIANLQSIRERKFLWSVDVIELNKKIAELTSQNQLLATLRESGCVDPDIFIFKSNKLTEQLRAAKQAKSRILNQDSDDTIPCTQELITILKRGPEMLHDFDGELFGQLIDKVIIESNTSLRFRLRNGLELRESIERTVR